MTIAVRRQPHCHARRRSGAIAFGIGTTQVRDVLATQCLSMAKPKLRQVRVDGTLARGVYAKDVILAIINQLGVKGGVGYAYEYAGDGDRSHDDGRAPHALQHVHRGRRALRLRQSRRHDHRVSARAAVRAGGREVRAGGGWWKSIATEPGATFDDVKRIDGNALEPVVTWGINPEMSVGVSQRIPRRSPRPRPSGRPTARRSPTWASRPGQPIKGAKIDVAFVGSCTNGRLSDLRIAAEVAKKGKVAKHVRALIVPGSQQVAKAAEAEGLHEIFQAAGFQWRKAGCSMCLGMNDDKLQGRR
jgi:3-isopropylmalate/(R)-2-methylmalate dehydratase large subunit